MSSTGELTHRQHAILEHITESIATRGYPPSLREIGTAVGLRSGSTVFYQLRQLDAKGYIKLESNRSRAIAVLRTAERPYTPVKLTEEELAQCRGLGQGQVPGVVERILNDRLKAIHDAE